MYQRRAGNAGFCHPPECLLGERGLVRLAALNHTAAMHLSTRLTQLCECRIYTSYLCNEFTIPRSATVLAENLAARGILGGVPAARFYPEFSELDNAFLVAYTETNSNDDIEILAKVLEEHLQ